MKTFKSQQTIGQLEKRKGGYFFLKIEADIIHFELNEDPNPLGVDMPAILEVVIEQDEHLKSIFGKVNTWEKAQYHSSDHEN